jgi:predicted secreted protein
MRWTSILAIYVLFWVMSLFVVLPFGVRNHAETGEAMVPGQADGAPANFNPRKVALYTTLVATIAFALYYINYVEGWVGVEALDFFGRKPDPSG